VKRDLAWSGGVAAIALLLYVRTLAPGLTADVDTAMFQFVGRVLGVAHNPGYPLYVLLTHAFSYLPIGSLAYRINLFSALFGALTVGLTFLVARRLGCRRAIAAAAALGLASGAVFWSQAVIAEVYTLNAAIVAGSLLSLLVWSQTRRARWYFLAVALFAAGLGNHTTIVGFAPGIVIFALLTDARFVLRLRALAVTAATLVGGLLQYVFVLWRSNQPGAYTESRATSFHELVRVVLGGQFQDRLFSFSPRALLSERLPLLLGSILVPELTIVGLALALAGGLWLLWRRRDQAALLLTGAVAVFAFALNYAVNDTPVFLVPTILVLWLVAAVGGERIAGAWRGTIAGPLVAVMCCALPAWLVATNFHEADRSRGVREDVQLDRLLEALPEPSALVKEDFLVDRMVISKLVGDGPGHGRQIPLTPPHVAAVRSRMDLGARVFAFPKSATRLRLEGADVSFSPVRLLEGPLDRFLARLPDGVIIAVGVPAAQSSAFAASRGASLLAIGGPSTLTGIAPSSIACVGARGGREPLLHTGRLSVSVTAAAREPVGGGRSRPPDDITVRADATEASVRLGSREIVRTLEGAVFAAWEPDGDLVAAFVLEAADDFQVPLPVTSLSAYPLGALPDPTPVDHRWTNLSAAFETASAIVHVPSGERLVLLFGDDTALAPRVVETTGGPHVTVAREDRASSANDEPGAEQLQALRRDPHRYRFEIAATAGDAAVFVATGGVPTHVFGRLEDAATEAHADIVRVETLGLLRSPDRRTELLQMGRDAQAQLTGDGWSRVDWDAAGPFRWMIAPEARLVLPIVQAPIDRIRVQALRDDLSPATTVGLRINDSTLQQQPLERGWHVYEWTLPRDVVSAGTNEACVLIDRLAPEPAGGAGGRGVAVSDVRLIRGGL
jgi:Protein of unknown function (DUF2723)